MSIHVNYALCRRVADGWLVLERGPYQEMRDAAKASYRRDRRGEYRAIATDKAEGAIVQACPRVPVDEFQTEREEFDAIFGGELEPDDDCFGEYASQCQHKDDRAGTLASVKREFAEKAIPRKQRMLLSDMDCLPDQQDLFAEHPD